MVGNDYCMVIEEPILCEWIKKQVRMEYWSSCTCKYHQFVKDDDMYNLNLLLQLLEFAWGISWQT